MAKQTIYNAGIYVRLSQEDMRAGESLSIENQKLILTKYVKEQGWNLVDTYVDDGWSGTDFDRPAVQRLLSDAQSGKNNLIICKDLSRFVRNYIEVGRYVDYIFPSYNIRFIALNDNMDTASKDTSALDIMPIVNLFNEWHAASTSKKIKAVIEANAKAGKYRTTCAPFGYTKGDDPNHLPVIDPDAAPIARNIFEMRASVTRTAMLLTSADLFIVRIVVIRFGCVGTTPVISVADLVSSIVITSTAHHI